MIKLRKSVQLFAEEMELVLIGNDYKGGWEKEDYLELLSSLQEEVEELRIALMSNAQPIESKEDDILREACDVANFAMMIADNFGALKRNRGK